jgi:hypothetical protein
MYGGYKQDCRDAGFSQFSCPFQQKNVRCGQTPYGHISPKDTTPTNHGAPKEQLKTVVENMVSHFEHKVRALNRGRNDTSKLAEVHGVRYTWQVGGEKPPKGDNLPKTKFTRKMPLIVTHIRKRTRQRRPTMPPVTKTAKAIRDCGLLLKKRLSDKLWLSEIGPPYGYARKRGLSLLLKTPHDF